MTGNGERADSIAFGYWDPGHRECDNCGVSIRGEKFYRTGSGDEFCLPCASSLGV